MNCQLILPIPFLTQSTLEDFCWENNELLKQQLRSLLDYQDEKYLYIWGEAGCGKTHLLQACCQAIQSSRTAAYLPLAQLAQWGPQAIEGMEELSFIAIDNIDSISGHTEWEEALLHLYNRLRDRGQAAILIAGRTPPMYSSIKLADLRSRLSWGQIAQVHELSDESKGHLLQQIAKKRGFNLPEAVSTFLISRCSRNIGDLLSILEKLDEASLAEQRKITLPFVKAALKMDLK